jgi:hypothetical protein
MAVVEGGYRATRDLKNVTQVSRKLQNCVKRHDHIVFHRKGTCKPHQKIIKQNKGVVKILPSYIKKEAEKLLRCKKDSTIRTYNNKLQSIPCGTIGGRL